MAQFDYGYIVESRCSNRYIDTCSLLKTSKVLKESDIADESGMLHCGNDSPLAHSCSSTIGAGWSSISKR
jgi:hypothetical protein